MKVGLFSFSQIIKLKRLDANVAQNKKKMVFVGSKNFYWFFNIMTSLNFVELNIMVGGLY